MKKTNHSLTKEHKCAIKKGKLQHRLARGEFNPARSCVVKPVAIGACPSGVCVRAHVCGVCVCDGGGGGVCVCV